MKRSVAVLLLVCLMLPLGACANPKRDAKAALEAFFLAASGGLDAAIDASESMMQKPAAGSLVAEVTQSVLGKYAYRMGELSKTEEGFAVDVDIRAVDMGRILQELLVFAEGEIQAGVTDAEVLRAAVRNKVLADIQAAEADMPASITVHLAKVEDAYRVMFDVTLFDALTGGFYQSYAAISESVLAGGQ